MLRNVNKMERRIKWFFVAEIGEDIVTFLRGSYASQFTSNTYLFENILSLLLVSVSHN